MERDYTSTVARIAGNLLSGVSIPDERIGPTVERTVRIAWLIVAEARRQARDERPLRAGELQTAASVAAIFQRAIDSGRDVEGNAMRAQALTDPHVLESIALVMNEIERRRAGGPTASPVGAPPADRWGMDP